MTDQPYQLLPPLSDEECAALREDIAAAGVRVPIDVDENGVILNGHHRKAIADELGIDCPVRVVAGLGHEDKRAHALSTNLNGRRLNREQRRALIVAELEHDDSRSDRAIARLLGVDHKTVGAVRRERRGEFPTASELTDEERRLFSEAEQRIIENIRQGDQTILDAVIKHRFAPAFIARQLRAVRAESRDALAAVLGDDYAVVDETVFCTRFDWLAATQAFWRVPSWRCAEEVDLAWLRTWAEARPAQHQQEMARWREAVSA